MKQTKREDKNFRTTIGGQALLEGIMMRGPKKQSIAVRTKDGINVKTDDLKVTKDKYPVAGLPFIRGLINFGSAMAAGVRALMYSANFMTDDIEAGESKLDQWIEKKLGSKRAEGVIVTISLVLGIGLSVVLFMLLPTVLAGIVAKFIDSRIIRNAAEGVLRVVIFVAYIGLTSLLNDMKRVWMYHGAEHKAVFCYEKGLPLTVENVRSQPRRHPRCGTSLMFIVMIVSILVFSTMSWGGVLMRVASRLLLLPVVVMFSYEIMRYAGRHDNVFTRIISAPGKALQRLTTSEPDDQMIEVAIAAITPVLPEKQGEDKW